MASEELRLEEGSNGNYGLEPNTSPTDELAVVSALARGAGELMIIQTLQRFIRPVLVPILTPLIREIVKEQIGLARPELLASMKENPTNEETTSVPKRLKLLFRNRISMPVFTGKRIVGENSSTIEIALVNAFTEQIIDTGPESTAKLEIVGFPVGTNDRLTFEEFQERVMSEKNGKRILQGETSLQLKEGICSVSKISFTHSSQNTKNGWYRLGVGVVDAALMNKVEVATTEAFLIKDGRTIYSEKLPHPRLSDKVCHLQQISYKGKRHGRLKDEGVITVKDLLTLVYTDPKRLQDILKVGASSNIWNDIVNNAYASSGVFLWLDPGNEGKTGVVLNAKLQLKGLIVEHHTYVPVDQLSAKQKVDNQELVKFASEHFAMLQYFEDETRLQEHLMSVTTFISNGLTETLNNSNLNLDERMTPTPTIISPYERGKETVPMTNEITYSINYHQEEPGTSCPVTESTANVVESTLNACGHMDMYNVFDQCLDCFINSRDSVIYFDNEWLSEPAMVAAQTVSICTLARARTRWTKVSKLLRRNSVRERITLTDGIQALKKHRCC